MFAGGKQGLALDTATLTLKVVDVADGDWQAAGVVVHDQTNRGLAHMLVEMPFGSHPMALGVLYDDPAPTFDSAVVTQKPAGERGQDRQPAEDAGAGPDLDGRQAAARDLTGTRRRARA